MSRELRLGLLHLREREGVRVSEQIRRAVRAWLQAKGVDVDALKREGAESR